jgi:plastocyanin
MQNNNLLLYFILALILVTSVTTPSSLFVFGQGMQSATTPTEQQKQPIVELSGQQYFANGTGIMYFNDNTTMPFIHSITPENGYYYDNSTLFLIGEIPGVSAEPKDIVSMMHTGTQVNITIPRGVEMLPDNQTFQPNVVRVKVGDLVSFVNNDFQVHRIVSPPHQGDINNANNTNTTTTTTPMATISVVPSGIIFDSIIEPGDSASVVFSSPGGFHFNDAFNENATGTIIVEK